MVSVRCAYPSGNQTTKGVKALLTYLVKSGDTISSIAKEFQASVKSALEENKLSSMSKIYPFTPILVPMAFNDCMDNPNNSSCKCPEWEAEVFV